MALYTVVGGNVIQVADLNQYYDLLTGGMVDQPVTLGNNVTAQGTLTANGAPSLTAAHDVTVGGNLTVSGAVESHNNPVVEGTAGQAAPLLNAQHVEAYADTTGTSLANSAETTRTITFARAYSVAPAVFVSARTTAPDSVSVAVGVDSISTTQCVIRVRNTDASVQTVYPMAFIVGA